MPFAANTPCALLILDGWGVAPKAMDNAISQAHTPIWDALWANNPHTTLEASGAIVGLPGGQMGNSEVGHLHIGAGRVCQQDLVRIHQAIQDESFAHNPVLLKSLQENPKARLHLVGLCSDGGVHSHIHHLLAAISLASKHPRIPCYVHAILDGRDTPPQSAAPHLERIQKALQAHPHGHLASMMGRYYAMDRDQRWDRTEAAYRCLSEPSKTQQFNPLEALQHSYAQGQTDEFVTPTTLDHSPIQNGDIVWFMNFRADRARQLCQALFQREQTPLTQPTVKLGSLVTLTDYGLEPTVPVAFPKDTIEDTLGWAISQAGLRQLRLAETEKYAHVTYFLNGGAETPYPLEDRELIESPKVATYDLQPEMSAHAVTDALLKSLENEAHDVILCNFANADMVGHTGVQKATEEAITTIDQCLERIVNAFRKKGGHVFITADHGNAEKMFDPSHQQPHTAHTSNPVPLLYIGDRIEHLSSGGSLIDIAPTILTLLNCPIPAGMTGHNLAEAQ